MITIVTVWVFARQIRTTEVQACVAVQSWPEFRPGLQTKKVWMEDAWDSPRLACAAQSHDPPRGRRNVKLVERSRAKDEDQRGRRLIPIQRQKRRGGLFRRLLKLPGLPESG